MLESNGISNATDAAAIVDVVDLLAKLVQIPSVNPDGDPGTPHTGEAAIAEYVGGVLRTLGAAVEIEEVLPGRPNVIGKFPSSSSGASGAKPRLLLAPHTDTVSVAGMVGEPFGGTVRDGRLYGRGASDTKGTMAAMLCALQELGKEKVAALGCEVTFVGLMGEESNQFGSKHFAEHHSDYDFAIVGEPTDCCAVVKTKGAFWPRIVTHGKAVHGSKPELGENAILKMASVLEAIDKPFRSLLKKEEWSDDLLGSSTVNIGMIQGGSRANIVADRCEVTLDIRVTPSLYQEGVENVLEEFLGSQCSGVEVLMGSVSPPLATGRSDRFVKQLEGLGIPLVGAPWFCDASWLAAGGIPAIAAGPGSIDQAHTADEWISIADLTDGVAFYKRILESF